MKLSGKRAMVFGTGKSGIGACNLLLGAGADPYFYDQNADADREKILNQLNRPVEIVLGDLPEEKYEETDIVVMSPGIPCDIPVVERFQKQKTPVWSEIELAWRCGSGKVLAVTGTNGKTTTTTLLGEIMKAYYPEVYVVGNIGNPYTDVALKQGENAWTVAEISSFQLETIEDFHPAASAITNITEDHLNRHHTMEEYIRVKERIAENQTPEDLCVLNYEDPELRRFGVKLPCRVCWFSSARRLENGIFLDGDTIVFADRGEYTTLMRIDEMQLLGLHNYENVMTAAAMARFAGVPVPVIRETIASFAGVEHRIEFVTEKNGVRFYNDSKGTNPDAAIKGIQAMNRPTLLIGGGFDKQSSYGEWIRSFDGKVKWFVLIGQTREKIRDAALACGFPEDRIILCEDLEEAVRICGEKSEPGDAVLLSPACASWGQFDNYEQRGDRFREFVKAL